jgi:HEXXH motif-containing protein
MPITLPRFDSTRRRRSGQWEPTVIGTDQQLAEIRVRLADAYSLLRIAAPRAASWVVQTTRTLTIANAPSKEVMVSSSDFATPGEIELSIPTEPAALAETLVHECAHQYLHLAELLGALDNGSDQRLYYSPIKRENRPIRAILVAFHAFANVALFYEAVLAGEAPRRAKLYCILHREPNLEHLGVLASHLTSSRGVTQIGDGLWKPLYAQLKSRGLLLA